MMAWLRTAGLIACLLTFFALALILLAVSRLTGRPPPAWASRLFCRSMLGVLGIRTVTHGAPSARARLVVANHVSWIDVLALGCVETPCFLAKCEVASWPVVSAFARLQGTVFVDRQRRRLLPAVNRTMADRLSGGRSVLLFPEGTTFDGSRRGPFRTSHLACLRDRFAQEPTLAGATAQAVALHYSDPVAAWIGDATLLPHVWAVLRRPGLVCTIRFGEDRSVAPGYDRKALGRALSGDVERLLGAAA